jgi:hypothetical protein
MVRNGQQDDAPSLFSNLCRKSNNNPFHSLQLARPFVRNSMKCFCLLTLLAPFVASDEARIGAVAYQTLLDGGINVGQGNGLTSGRAGDDIVFLTTRGGELLTIKGSTGEVLNRYDPPFDGECLSLVDWNDGTESFGVYAVGNTVILLHADGTVFEEFTIHENRGQITTQPLATKNLVFVLSNTGNNGQFSVYDPFSIDLSRRLIAQQSLSSALVGPATKSENAINFGASIGIVFQVDTAVGTDYSVDVFGMSPTFEDMRGRPNADTAGLLMQSPAGTLYRFDLNSGDPTFITDLASAGVCKYRDERAC